MSSHSHTRTDGDRSGRALGEKQRRAVETATIGVVGMGYVGLPLGIAFAEEGHNVIGYDVDVEKVRTLRNGVDPTDTVGEAGLAAVDVQYTQDPATVADADYVMITVPTPVDDQNTPDLSFVHSAARTVGDHMTPGTTVVLESTVYPGVTRDEVVPLLEEHAGLSAGETFDYGYSPERLSPGQEGKGLRDVVKVVSGNTDVTLDELAHLYGQVVDAGVFRAPTIETAEAAKVMENVQRDLNVALVNELSIICDHIDVDTHEVLEAAGSKWNFHEYEPGLVGGHCIPVDPLYMARGAEQAGFTPGLILQGREVNEYMPKHAADLAIHALNESGRVLKEARLLVLGLAYKPNVEDIRTSQVEGVIGALADYGVEVVGYDPRPPNDAMREYFEVSIQDEPSLDGFDGVILATAHDEFQGLDPDRMAATLNDDPVLVDLDATVDRDRAEAAGFEYRCL